MKFNQAILSIENVIKLKGFSAGYDNELAFVAIDEIKGIGYMNPTNHEQIILDGVILELEAFRGNLQIKYIESTKKGRGNGTLVMKEIFEIVDRLVVDITLTAYEVGDTKKSQLLKWYKSLGFVDEKDYLIRHAQ